MNCKVGCKISKMQCVLFLPALTVLSAASQIERHHLPRNGSRMHRGGHPPRGAKLEDCAAIIIDQEVTMPSPAGPSIAADERVCLRNH